MQDLLDFRCIDVTKHTSNHISSSGGDGFILQGTGHIKPVEISSETRVQTELWLLDPHGQEHSITVGEDLRVRKGHNLTLAVMGSELLSIFNHNTQTENLIHSSVQNLLLENVGKKPTTGCLVQIILIGLLAFVSFCVASMFEGMLMPFTALDSDLEGVSTIVGWGTFILLFVFAAKIEHSNAKKYKSKESEFYELIDACRNALRAHEHCFSQPYSEQRSTSHLEQEEVSPPSGYKDLPENEKLKVAMALNASYEKAIKSLLQNGNNIPEKTIEEYIVKFREQYINAEIIEEFVRQVQQSDLPINEAVDIATDRYEKLVIENEMNKFKASQGGS